MAKTLDSNQTQKIDKPFVAPVYLIHLLLDSGTLYFSDRTFTYNSHNYEDYFYDLSEIGNMVRTMGGYENSHITLRFKNEKFQSSNYLIEFFDTYSIEKKYVEIYKLYADTDEVFATDVSTKIFKGEMGQPYDITDIDFKVDCSSMLFGKSLSLPLQVIDTKTFPSADPDDIGKYRNIVYGSVKKLICPWTVAGWLSTLTADITAAATSIVVTDSTTAPAVPFHAYIDNEIVEVTVNTTATGTLTVTRAHSATTAVIHNKGAQIYEEKTTFEAEVAQHSVSAINNVYVKRGSGEWLRVVAGATTYTNTGGRAYVVFSDKVKYEEKTNESLTSEPHTHTFSGYTTKTCYPTWGSTASVYDGNTATYSVYLGGDPACSWTFTESTALGSVYKVHGFFVLQTCSVTLALTVSTASLTVPAQSTYGTYRLSCTASATGSTNYWGAPMSGMTGLVAGGSLIYEAWKEIEYSPVMASTTVTKAGNSVANMMIGDLVACDVDGYTDDTVGTYTGTGGALIENPAHIRKHILMNLLKFISSDIDSTSFTATATIYTTRGYEMGFVLHEVATETMDLFGELDRQTGSNMFESQGVFHLSFRPTITPTSQITFTADNIKGLFNFGKTEVADIRNKIIGHYYRDYAKSGDPGDEYQAVSEFSDWASISKYGQMNEDISFSCVGDLKAMVNDVLAWHILSKKDLLKTVKFQAFWDANILEQCDYFTVTSNFWSGNLFKTVSLIERPGSQIIEIEGIEVVCFDGLVIPDRCSHIQTVTKPVLT